MALNLFEAAKSLEPSLNRIERVHIPDSKGEIRGWHCYAYSRKDDHCLSGGTAATRDQALRICLAELFERALVFQLRKRGTTSDCGLESHPTTCGFAAGFDPSQTHMRAFAEGLERWIWSQWIDMGFEVPQIGKPRLSALSEHLAKDFETLQFHSRFFSLGARSFRFGVVIGLTTKGAFPGSRVCAPSEDPWEHSIIEAWRNLDNFRKRSGIQSERMKSNIAYRRSDFFAQNRDLALFQINRAHCQEWRRPEILLDKNLPTGIPEVFLSRVLFKDGIPWHEGPLDRFVY